ncbi:PREDICTED: pyroglutamyl-peptidase 1-like [Priapulus caudatus]|uniref:Pyroglutamyl-peptidase 1-like n=1 Tax=Priapulus caudatus TaxID=37621 RepID=A0ABM1EA66_PRICU|nr:PREDICTED: pyroglutamyl-peptidase 1-like [Priapulus caudatus]
MIGFMSIASSPLSIAVSFGPFGVHHVNSSWVAIQKLREMGVVDGNVHLVIQRLPVEYDAVRKLVPELWEKHNPTLMVHTGVSGAATELVVEKLAHNDGYCSRDVCGLFPSTQCCVEEGATVLETELDVEKVCRCLNEVECKVVAVPSMDAGRYLCDFCYYTSLNINRRATVFIHVPPLDKPYSASQMALGLRVLITALLEQVS